MTYKADALELTLTIEHKRRKKIAPETYVSLTARSKQPLHKDLSISGSIGWNGKTPSMTYFRQEQEVEGTMNWEHAEAHMYRRKWMVPEQAEYGSKIYFS